MVQRFRAQDAEADHLAVAQPRVANDDATTARGNERPLGTRTGDGDPILDLNGQGVQARAIAGRDGCKIRPRSPTVTRASG